MFLSIKELVEQAEAYPSVAELMIAEEENMTGRSREQIIALMEKIFRSCHTLLMKEHRA